MLQLNNSLDSINKLKDLINKQNNDYQFQQETELKNISQST